MRGLLAATALLTRFRVGMAVTEDDLRRSVLWFPVVGAAVGLALALVYLLLYPILPPLVAGTVTVALGMVLTGGLHEDGLADTADGFGGGKDRDDILRIMREPALGSFGVGALVTSSLLRIGSLAAITPEHALLALPLVHLAARSGIVLLIASLPAASPTGLAAAHDQAGMEGYRIPAIGLALGAGGLALGWVGIGVGIAALAAAGLTGAMAMRRLGGLSGDVLGAAEQTSETVGLVIIAALAGTRP